LSLKPKVLDFMRSPAVTALFSDPVTKIAEKMFANNIGAVIIISGGLPKGIITERDIVKGIVRGHKDPKTTKSQEIMSSPLFTVETENTVFEAYNLMKEKNVRRLAVTRNGKLVGMITERRLLNSMMQL
jgi:signal-transduction protein with cAMP-binding, CBS, and nucleotidyltransferase domain